VSDDNGQYYQTHNLNTVSVIAVSISCLLPTRHYGGNQCVCLTNWQLLSSRRNQDSSVSTVSALRPVRSRGSNTVRGKNFSSKTVRPALQPTQSSINRVPRFFVGEGVKRPELGTWSLSLIYVCCRREEWVDIYISTPLYAFVAWTGKPLPLLFDCLGYLWFEYWDKYSECVGVGRERFWRSLKCYPRLEITRITLIRTVDLWLWFERGTSRMRHLIG
jgi:hypothetical protein